MSHPLKLGVGKPACGACGKFRPGEAWELGRDCRLCWLMAHDPAFKDYNWGGGIAVNPAPPPGSDPPRIMLELRPVCKWQGEEVAGCRTCGGEGTVLYYCDSPDDEADRCIRGYSADPSIRSCLDCEHFSPR